ncbi:MAG: hypothetical protein A2Y59_02080 [Chloroflexi bacterium RBG_13_52_14]|jgi:hypothetical protein|nr:MAG: hypothetical protein A2Y59_02080 [Chloroflexi bacterium RBG_13_52_14]
MAQEKLPKVVCYDCVNRHHLVARCPSCATGTLMTTCKDDFNGVSETICVECNETIALYVLMKERRAWILAQPVEMVSKRVT